MKVISIATRDMMELDNGAWQVCVEANFNNGAKTVMLSRRLALEGRDRVCEAAQREIQRSTK